MVTSTGIAAFVRLFRLTRTEYFADFLITPPVTIASIVLSLIYGATIWWPAQFAAGLLAWTLYEYLIHRFVAHRVGIFRYWPLSIPTGPF